MPDKLEKSCRVGKAVQPLQSVKNYSNSRVHGHGHAWQSFSKLDYGFGLKMV